ncbi:hypothetical protein RchiOBHm_Chr2g0129301 [Rosa chinensis]|uniref:DUF7787 domain-containing protein n=1 Tax=Rosa chinensis TaxID=74649 RepID=A0A2P6RUI5_ROSCH|nr:hypothetical protein RchiOBHm_Chr2g0129301 [Rosa chinensis]
MEMASKAKNNANAKMSLDDYLLLLQSGSHLHLTVSHLNQIISMHGYKKIHKVHKLLNPCRSTLRDYISPFVTTKMDDVFADLSDLNWQDCCITSIHTLSSWEDQSPPPPNGAVQFQHYSPSTAAHSVIVSAPGPTKKRSARKRKRTAKVADLVNFA